MKRRMIAMPLALAAVLMNLPASDVYASNPFEGAEDQWLAKCATAQSSKADAQQCREFKEYYAQKSKDREQQVADMKKTSDGLAADLSNLHDKIAELDAQIKGIDAQIASAEANVASMQNNIVALDGQMAEKQEQIKALDEQVKKRMQSEQVNIGTNRYIDVIMGARDIVEMVRLIDGINLVTQNDQDQMEEAAKVRQELKLQQDEQKRLQEDVKAQIEENEKLKEVKAVGKQEQEKLYEKYYQKQQDIMQQMETAQADISSMQGAIAGINTNVRDDIFQKPTDPETPDSGNDGNHGGNSGNTPGNTSWVKPIKYSWYSGTWSYDAAGLYPHLGADYSGPVGAAVVAPARSIVLYANDPYPSTQVGSMLGWPYGGGNTIHLLTQVNGTTYGISYFHLSQGILVSPGQLVEQGQTVAYSGSSGNVTGPHLHVEVINLGSMSITDAQARFASTADFAWGSGWSTSSACSVRSAPCRERPEDIFGY